MSSTLVLISLVAGLLIGAIGVGGVLLVPGLTYVVGVDVHEAIPACMLSFLPTGIIALAVYARHGSIRWPLVGWLCLGAVPFAYLGSVVLPYIPSDLVMALIAGLMIVTGTDALRKSMGKSTAGSGAARLKPLHFVGIGAVTGFGSAISGTGGPLILVPILIYLGLPVLISIGLSQAIQIPIAAFASLGNWMGGNLNLDLALVISVALVAGALAGAIAIHRLPGEPIRKFVSGFIIVTGLAIGLRLLAGFV